MKNLEISSIVEGKNELELRRECEYFRLGTQYLVRSTQVDITLLENIQKTRDLTIVEESILRGLKHKLDFLENNVLNEVKIN